MKQYNTMNLVMFDIDGTLMEINAILTDIKVIRMFTDI